MTFFRSVVVITTLLVPIDPQLDTTVYHGDTLSSAETTPGMLAIESSNEPSRDSSVIAPFWGTSIRYGMDTTVSPCVDFYAYANGNWRKSTIVPQRPDGLPILIDIYTYDLRHRGMLWLEQHLDSILTTNAAITDPIDRHLKKLISSCLHADSIDMPLRSSKATTSDSTRKKLCTARMFKHAPRLLGYKLFNFLLPTQAQAKIDSLAEAIRLAAIQRIRNNTWLSSSEKEAAVELFKRLHYRIGIPANLIAYDSLVLSDDYLNNILSIKEYEYKTKLFQVGGNPRDNSLLGIFTANALYSSGEHTIEIAPILFTEPIFSFNGDDAINFGRIGTIIGHESFHSIDNLISKKADSIFRAKKQDYLAFYSTIGKLDNWSVSPARTFSEDVADLGAILVTYDAWKAFTKDTGVIDGFTPDQRFYIAVAQNYRAKWSGTRFSSNHSPPFARTHAMILNSPAFANAFGCHDTDPMVLPVAKRPDIW